MDGAVTIGLVGKDESLGDVAINGRLGVTVGHMRIGANTLYGQRHLNPSGAT